MLETLLRPQTTALFKGYDFKDYADEKITWAEGQLEIADCILNRSAPDGKKRVQIIAATQYGKKISDDTLVLTVNGWKTHGELQIGDKVFSPEGKAVLVKNVMNDGVDVDYEIEFSNGEKIKCHGQHEWIVCPIDSRRSKRSWRILETQQIAECYKRGKRHKYFLPFVQPLQFNERKLPLDPYFLGVWLGDGISTKPSFVGGIGKKAILSKVPYKVSSEQVHKTTGVSLYNFYRCEVLKNLKKLNLLQNKHIPYIYQRSSVTQRLELLAGLIDTDGSVNKQRRENNWQNGRVYISNANQQLVNDICELIRGLGMRVSVTKVKACLSSSGVQGKQAVYYIGFQPYLSIPTVIEKKKIFPLDKKRHLSIKAVRRITSERGKCIEVEGGLYLVGKTLIPTHNSIAVAAAVVVRASVKSEKWAIVAGTKEKARIIMDYIIMFSTVHPLIRSQLIPGTSIERLRMRQSQDRIVYKRGGEVRVYSADATKVSQVSTSLLGFGSPNVIGDESSLIPDTLQATVMRMLGGSSDNFLVKIGNPFNRNHFLRTWQSHQYWKIFIDYKRALSEGRFSEEFVNEMMQEPLFSILYECKFPPEGTIDDEGWLPLLTESEVERAEVDPMSFFGELKMGCDVAGGGRNYSAIVLRAYNLARLVYKTHEADTMVFAEKIISYAQSYGVKNADVAIDKVGIGRGAFDHVHTSRQEVLGVGGGDEANNKLRFSNLRAEMYWRAREWILAGGKLERSKSWQELSQIKYKVDSKGRIKLMSKEEMLKHGIDSPDIADSLAMTFARGKQERINQRTSGVMDQTQELEERLDPYA
jgi:hypothetical protein